MSGSNSSAPSSVSAGAPEPLAFAVHSLPDPAALPRRQGRLRMLLVMAICAAPVVASYLTFYVIKPRGSAHGELIEPSPDLPADLPLQDLQGRSVAASSLRGQWLVALVQPADCPASCEQLFYAQRQLREMLGKDRDRVDKVWLIPQGPGEPSLPRPELVSALNPSGAPVTILRVPAARLDAWLKPAPGHSLAQYFFVIDPMGRWMMRSPAPVEPASLQTEVGKLKADLTKLLKASASWDPPGR